tara:strand:+ start:17899 stop:18795 length:897 start_codon:yes stop_codon:yes gene_type:complete
MQKALVVGSRSFFGRHFIKKASKILDLTCLNSTNCNLLTDKIYDYNQEQYDYIFYFAVKTAAGGYCQRHPAEQFLINQRMNTTMLNYWKTKQPEAKFITFGTSCSYSDEVEKKVENYFLGHCESGYEVYGMVKRMLLVGLRAFQKEYDMRYMFYIPSCLYGPEYDKNDGHFIYDVAQKICNAQINPSQPAILWGDGHQRRELIYVEDAVDVLLSLLDRENEVINLSTGKDYSIRQYAKIICDTIDYDFQKIEFDVTKFVGAREKRLVVDKLKDFTFTDPSVGLANLVNFYRDNYEGKE